MEAVGPRILVASFEMGDTCEQCIAVVAHAPIEAAKVEAKNAFWKDMKDALDRHLIKSPDAEVYGMIDANARVSHGKEREEQERGSTTHS